jgi:NAD(P)-dependent dehydrogenase (short-subunit alcohol dehydrogenase family)
VVVTGAAGGIGLGLLEALLKVNAIVVGIDKSERILRECSNICVSNKNSLMPICADLKNKSEMDTIIDRVVSEYGHIDVLVNCAGVNTRKELSKYTDEEWDNIHDVNVRVIFQLSNKVAEIMKRKKKGRIINLSSTQGMTCWNGRGRFSLAPYCASKAAVIALTKAFALDLAQYNITVNAVCPAFVNTDLVKSVKDDEELYDDIISRTPLGRFAGISEIVAPIMFLASDESSFITGHALLVDGGWTIE